MACLFLLIAVLFYICGRLHAWYKHSLVPMTASNSATGMKSSRNATVFRPRAVIIRRVRNYLKPGRISRKRELGTVPTEPACRVENGHITAVAEATIKIEALIKAADDQKLPLGESLYLQWMTSNLQDVVMSQKAEIGQLKAANSLHHLIIPATPPQDARAEHEIAELKNELARSGEETRKAKIHRRELEDRLARMENERETNEVKAEKAETLEQMIINLKAELTHQRTTAKHDRKLLTEARNKIRSRDTELSEAAKAMTATQDQLKQVQDTCAEAMTAIQDQMSVLPGEPHVCDHGACQAIVQQELAALKEAKDVEIMELRIANDTETRALRRSLEASMTNFNTKSFKVSLLEGDLEGAKRGCESAVIENSTLRRAGQQIEVENAELKLKLSTMQREIASEKAKYKQLEGLQSLERTTLAPPVAHLGRSDDAAIPFENLPLSWPRPRVVEPEPTQTTRIAARVRAPMRSQTQAAGDDTSPLPTPSSSSAGLCQPARKQMDKLNEDDFAMRMKKYADQATNLHQKWNRANMTNAAGSGDVVKNFQEILRSWEYVKPEMLQESKLGQAVMRVLGTEGKWQGQPLAAISGVRRPPHVLMIKLGKEIQSKMAEMGQDQENKGGKRSRS
ncbi:MAG: hypothetical protein M1830_010108 [Pleopsidium flavum]|nr:MAG: hypothetical protein M1830_010108 [Pleopsidium flavum]